MKITLFGTGYVGLVTGACLAEVGHQVMCMDVDKTKIETLQQGGLLPIYEPGLEDLIVENRAIGNLAFTSDIPTAVDHADLLFIAVGTPPDEDGSADLRHVLDVATNIGKCMSNSKLVVIKSTVPVGTSDKVRATIQAALDERGCEFDIALASNPEFLKEGSAVGDFMKPDRIVVGTDSTAAREILSDLYAPFNANFNRMLFMDIRSAELTKYVANALLATKISFINEVANLVEHLGGDIEQVRRGIGSDPRIGYHFIYPGCGYGGSCLPKDVRALSRTAQEGGFEMGILSAVEAANERQKGKIFSNINQHFNGNISGMTFALWGLAFKPRTDDMREAPSRVLLEALWEAGARVKAYDPEAMDEARRLYPDQEKLILPGTRVDALHGADALIVCTEWQHFRAPDFEMIKHCLSHPVIFDGRNLYDPARMASLGIQYYGIGRGLSVRHKAP